MAAITNINSSQTIKLQENDTGYRPISSSQNQQADVNRSRTWTQSELYLIAAFLHYNSLKFASLSSKKHFKIFKYMSLFVQSRNINQCRSYTNKLLKSFDSIQNINKFFQESLPLYSQIIDKLKPRNELIFSEPTQMQNNTSAHGMCHHIDQIIAESSSSKPSTNKTCSDNNEQLQPKILIPQARRTKLQDKHSPASVRDEPYQMGIMMMDWGLLLHQMCFFA